MDRHPFANPVHSYSRVTSAEYGPPDPYANLHSFPPMSSEDSFRRWYIPATPPPPPGRPSQSDRSGYTYSTYNDNDNLNDNDGGMHMDGLNNRNSQLPRWRRALKKMKRQAKRSLDRLRRMLDLL